MLILPQLYCLAKGCKPGGGAPARAGIASPTTRQFYLLHGNDALSLSEERILGLHTVCECRHRSCYRERMAPLYFIAMEHSRNTAKHAGIKGKEGASDC